jgi:hypothetical protein
MRKATVDMLIKLGFDKPFKKEDIINMTVKEFEEAMKETEKTNLKKAKKI